jgi:PAS domain S-box-containing protein
MTGVSTSDVTVKVEPGDGSERHAADIERLVAAHAREIALSAAKYRELFDASPDMYVTLGPAGQVEEVNRTTLRLTGRQRDELVGLPFMRLLSSTARRSARAAIPAFLEHGSLENLELQVPRRTGPALEVIANAEAVRDPGGRLAGARVVLRDITHRIVLERQLSLVDRLAATGQLAAGVAHEINNPLQAVMVHLSLVEEALGPDFPEFESWSRIKEGVRRIQQIVAELLDLHRGTEREVGPVEINRVAGEAFGLVQVPLRHRSIAAQLELGIDLPPVRAVGRHVYQVVLNLLLNAMDAMPAGGTLGLRTRRAPGSSEIEIDISDSGPGIPGEMLAHIFDPFTAGARKASGGAGTGLGLFVTYGLVRRHGGRIQVDSAPGRGSQFRVFFPLAE